VKRKQHGMSNRFEDGCLYGAARFVANGQLGYLRLGDQVSLYASMLYNTEQLIPENCRLRQNCNRHAGGIVPQNAIHRYA
jgi:hypothetical protein